MRNAKCEKVIEYIRKIEHFSCLSDERIIDIASTVRIARHQRGALLYFQGDASETVYFLQRGRIKLTRMAENGSEVLLDIVAPAEIFGETSAIMATPQTDSAHALEDALVCEMPRKAFRDLLTRHQEVSSRILERVTTRLLQIEGRFVDLVSKDLDTRVKETLADLATTELNRSSRRPVIVPLTQQDFAAMVGASRQETSKALKRLKDDDIVDLKYRSIIVKSPDKLRKAIAKCFSAIEK